MKIDRNWILPVLLLIGIISLSIYAYNQIMTKTTLGKTEIKNRVESLFNGEVQSVTKNKARYEVTFLRNDFLYEVSVDETEGTFTKITLLEEGKRKEEPVETEKPPKEEKKEDKPVQEEPEALKPLTEQQISEIARSKFGGEVDEMVYVGTTDGGYYNVDMENDEDEATLQIHALTGEILTITYDD